MKLLRSSPFKFLRLACLLQSVVLSCCVLCLAPALGALPPLRQELMNFLRSSPFLSPACLLQAVMRSCCFEGAFLSCARASGAAASSVHDSTAMSLFMILLP